VNAYEVKAGIGVIASNTVCSMPERLECEVLQKVCYINTLTFTFYLYNIDIISTRIVAAQKLQLVMKYEGKKAFD